MTYIALPQNAQDGYAAALAADSDLDVWCQKHAALAEAVVQQLARYAMPLTVDEYAQQIARRLTAAKAVGPERAAAALGLDVGGAVGGA
jgi:hypothetical protein